MTTTKPGAGAIHAAATYLAVVQFFFAGCWIVYVIHLPGLLKSVGLDASLVIWFLMADQLVFALTDLAMGLWLDRIRGGLRRFGPVVLAMTAFSCLAFLLLPYVARSGGDTGRGVFIALLVVWTVTSSALRAPPLALLGTYAPAPSLPWALALNFLGLALAGALSPYFGGALKAMDPRLPFAVSSAALFATTLGLVWIERALAAAGPQAAEPKADAPRPRAAPLFFAACAALALGFQIHFFVNSAPRYLVFAKPADLDLLMPVFWIGFNFAMFPAATLAKRLGEMPVMAAAVAVGIAGILATVLARDLTTLVVGQALAGAGWGATFVLFFAGATAYGRVGREGRMLGALWAVVNVAVLARMATGAAGLGRMPEYADILSWGPAVAWTVGLALLLVVAWRWRGGARAPA